MNLNLAWEAPTPAPSCGYKALFKRKGDPVYTEIDVTGITTTITVDAPACYEGAILADCCSGNVATGAPFGTNAYSTFTLAIVLNETNSAEITVTSEYPNPYSTAISFSYDSIINTTTTTHNVDIIYPAHSTTYTEVVSSPYPATTTLSNLVFLNSAAYFDNGGSLQQFDSVLTPSYFQFYYSLDSIPAWNGAPTLLPSFTLDRFVVTEVDVDLVTVLAGRLDISYILTEYVITSFTNVQFDVYDGVSLIGTAIASTGSLGARSLSINLTKATNPLSTSTVFTMTVTWPDTTVLDTKTFYLPSF